MDLVSKSPFSIASVTWQPEAGAWNLTVCVKATFALVAGGEARLATEQDPAEGDTYFEDNARGSLYLASDFAPYKPRADVLFVGSAHAPAGGEARDLVARLTVGDFTKAVRVVGDRAWVRSGGGALAAGTITPFRTVPLRYERGAARGDNLGGVTASAKQAEAGQKLPNVELVEDREGATPGFGPVPPAWRARRGHLGEAAILWAFRAAPRDAGNGVALEERPASPPPGFDFGFFNAAPRDQQLDLLRQASSIVLENLHPEIPRFETRLPNLKPRVFREAPGSKRAVEVAMRCDTLWIDGARSVAVLSWRGITPIPAPDPDKFGRFMVIAETPGEKVRLEDVITKFGGATEEKVDDLNVRHDAVRPVARPGTTTQSMAARTEPFPGPAPVAHSPQPIAHSPLPVAADPPRGPSTHPPPSIDPEAADDAHTPTPDVHTSTDVLAAKLDGSVLPFKPVSGPPTARAPEVPGKLAGLPFRPSGAPADPSAGRLGALPFKPAGDAPSASSAPPAVKPSERWGDDDRTRPIQLPTRASLPFGRPLVADDPSTTPDSTTPPVDEPTTNPKPVDGPRSGSTATFIELPRSLPKMPELVKKPQGGMRLGGGLGPTLGKTALGDSQRPSEEVPPADEQTEFDDRPPFEPTGSIEPDKFRHVPEPPMLGPLANPQPVVETPKPAEVKKPEFLGALYAATPAPEVPPAAPSTPGAAAIPPPKPSVNVAPDPLRGPSVNVAPPPAPSSPEAAPKIDPEVFPIERCAAINAEIAIKRAPMPEVLKKHQVEPDAWTAADRHWLAAITKETERGKTTLLGSYDAAYVAALEKLRGPITIEEYARIVVGVERGDVAAVLAALGLPRTALMRIERVWTKRLAEDPKLAQTVGAAVESARKA